MRLEMLVYLLIILYSTSLLDVWERCCVIIDRPTVRRCSFPSCFPIIEFLLESELLSSFFNGIGYVVTEFELLFALGSAP